MDHLALQRVYRGEMASHTSYMFYIELFCEGRRPEELFADRLSLRPRSHTDTLTRRIGFARLTLPLLPPERLRNDARARAMEEMRIAREPRSAAALFGGGRNSPE